MSRRKGNGGQNNNQAPAASFTNQDIQAYTKWFETEVLKKYRGEIKSAKTTWVVFKDDRGNTVSVRPEVEIDFHTVDDTIKSLQTNFDSTSAPSVDVQPKAHFDSTTM